MKVNHPSPFPVGGPLTPPPSVADQGRFSATARGVKNTLRYTYVASKPIPATGLLAPLVFFDQSRPTAAAAGNYTNLDGNGGQLPAGMIFTVQRIWHLFKPGVALAAYGAGAVAQYLNDLAAFEYTGELELKISTTDPIVKTGPMITFPAPVGLDVAAALSDASTAAADQQSRIAYGTADGEVYHLAPAQTIEPQVQFQVYVNPPAAAVPLPSGLQGTCFIYLDGILSRNV